MAYTNAIYQFGGDTSQARGNFTWKGKMYLLNRNSRFVYGQIDFDDTDFTAYIALVNARNDVISRNLQKLAEGVVDPGLVGGSPLAGDGLEAVPDAPSYAGDQELTLNVYADETLFAVLSINDQKPFRLGTSGKRARRWEFEIVGNVPSIKSIGFASSMAELKG